MMKKRMICFAAAVLMITGALLACGCSCNQKVNPKIAVLLPSSDELLDEGMKAELNSTLESLSGQYGIEYIMNEYATQAEMNEFINTLVGWKPNAVVMMPVDADEAADSANLILDAELALILLDKPIVGVKPTALTFSGESRTYEELADDAAAAIQVFKTENKLENINCIELVSKGDDSKNFTASVNAKLEGAEVIASLECADTTYESAKEAVKAWLDATDRKVIEKLNVCIADDDAMARGAMDAFHEYDKGKLRVKLIVGAGGEADVYGRSKLGGATYITYAAQRDLYIAMLEYAADIAVGNTTFDTAALNEYECRYAVVTVKKK